MLPTVTQDTFTEKVIKSPKPVLVKFTADWCQPCKQMSETLRDLTPELGDHIQFVEIDAEQNASIANALNVRGLPTLVLVKNGHPLASLGGSYSKPKIRSWIIDQLGL